MSTESESKPFATEWQIERIKPYPHNPRTHPPDQIALLAKLLRKYGPDQPIVVDTEGVIIKGHGRYMAARQAGLKTFPVVQRHGLSEVEKSELRISDNKVALLADWDTALMQMAITDLSLAGFDTSLLGFSSTELAGFMAAPTEARDPDAAPERPDAPVSKLGDLWQMGDHRLICGDATEAATWGRLTNGEKAAMVFTDPPYGVSYEATSGQFAVIEGDAKRQDELFQMLEKSFKQMAAATTETAAFYIWHASSTRNDFVQAMTAAGLVERQYLIWAKPGIGIGYADYRWCHEPCFYASKAERKPEFYAAPGESTVWRVEVKTPGETATVLGPGLALLDGQGHVLWLQPKTPKTKKVREVRITNERPKVRIADEKGLGTVWEIGREHHHAHPTQKPFELARRAIENSSKRGDTVADGFAGSGTTLIGAEATGRRCFAVELDPIYCDVVIKRWQSFTGKKALLDGERYEDVALERRTRSAA